MSEQDNGDESEHGHLDSITETLYSIQLKNWLSGFVQPEKHRQIFILIFHTICSAHKTVSISFIVWKLTPICVLFTFVCQWLSCYSHCHEPTSLRKKNKSLEPQKIKHTILYFFLWVLLQAEMAQSIIPFWEVLLPSSPWEEPSRGCEILWS